MSECMTSNSYCVIFSEHIRNFQLDKKNRYSVHIFYHRTDQNFPASPKSFRTHQIFQEPFFRKKLRTHQIFQRRHALRTHISRICLVGCFRLYCTKQLLATSGSNSVPPAIIARFIKAGRFSFSLFFLSFFLFFFSKQQ